MAVIGIVSEYNPFHSGHGHHIAESRRAVGEDAAVVAVMSGNWVQRGAPALTDKWTRARLAVSGGADLVLELPTVWAMSSAESFARGALDLLEATGVTDILSFGSECGRIAPLCRVADCLDSPAYGEALRGRLTGGAPFAVCRQQAVEELLGGELAGLLSTPNNNLGIEYLRALRGRGSAIRPMTVRREGAGHDAVAAPGDAPRFLSATHIRELLLAGRWDQAAPYWPAAGRPLLEGSMLSPAAAEQMGRALLARLRAMTADDWALLPDSGAAEGLPRRLERAGRQCADLGEFFTLAKTKRYTRARLERLALWAFLGLRADDIPETPPYLRVLAFNGRGQEVLREMKERARLPVLTRAAQARELPPGARRLFELESRCTDLYGLFFDPARPAGLEWTTPAAVLTEE